MTQTRWYFLPIRPAEDVRDPFGSELFASEGQATALVRESSQNSLDASTGGPTRLVFTLGVAEPADAEEYLSSLRPHLTVQDGLADRLPAAGEPVSYLNIEDFGTCGLTGTFDLTRFDEGDEERFLGFLRYEGLSVKTAGNRGSWGIGKTVFPAASTANSLFALTKRSTDDMMLLMGRAQLKSHRDPENPDTRLQPYGKYAEYQTSGGEPIPHPIQQESVLRHFRETFGLQRQSETGLSVVVPFPGEDVSNFDELARAAIEHCFAPILQRQLVIEIRSNEQHVVLDDDTIMDSLDEIEGWSEGKKAIIRSRLEFANWSLGTTPSDLIEILPPESPSICREMFGDDLVAIGERFMAGERLAFRVPVRVEPVGSEPVWSYMEVFVQLDCDLSKPDDHYIRKGVLASELHGTVPSGVRAITLVADDHLAGLLRLSEDVPHTKWRQRGIQRVTERYVRPTHAIGLACRAANEIINILMTADERPDDQMLAPFFPEEDDRRSRRREGGGQPGGRGRGDAGDGDGTSTSDPPENLGPPAFRYGPIDTGFRLRGEPDSNRPLRPIRVRVAYETFSGSALARYRPEDFILDDGGGLVVESSGVDVRSRQGNTIEFTPNTRNFCLEVTGFDARRALRVVPVVLAEDIEDGDAIPNGSTED